MARTVEAVHPRARRGLLGDLFRVPDVLPSHAWRLWMRNAAIYRRDDVVCRPVPDLSPCELAVLWRRDDRRPAVQVVTEACCRCVAADRDATPAGG